MYHNLEKVAGPVGNILAGAGGFVAKHPVGVMTGIGALGAINILLNLGNKLRGTHQIMNEAGKRQVMNYQTDLLKQIIENTKQKELGQKQDIPIPPPLR